MIRQVIFDWSGTLSDDESVIYVCCNEVLQLFGAEPVSRAVYQQQYHRGQLFAGRLPNQSALEIERQLRLSYQRSQSHPQLFEGVRELLALLALRKIPVFLLSALTQRALEEVVLEVGLVIPDTHIYGGKDKRTELPKLLLEHDLNADETLFVGDSVSDVEAAKVAGVRSGAALFGLTEAVKLLACGPDYAFDSIADIFQLLDLDYLRETVPTVQATVGGLLVNEFDEVLLVKTRKWSNKYGTPGGKIDYGETMEQAYYREVREETGLEIDNAQWVVAQDSIDSEEFYQPKHFILINYLTRVSGRPALCNNYEAHEIDWYPVEQALKLDLNVPTRKLIEQVLAEQLLVAPSP